MTRFETKEGLEITKHLKAGKTYDELKKMGYSKRLMYEIGVRLRTNGVELKQGPRTTHDDVREAIQAGLSYDEIEKKTKKSRSTIYRVAHAMRCKGYTIQCGYSGTPKSRKSMVEMMHLGSLKDIMILIDDKTFDKIANEPGGTWSKKIMSYLQKEDPPKRA